MGTPCATSDNCMRGAVLCDVMLTQLVHQKLDSKLVGPSGFMRDWLIVHCMLPYKGTCHLTVRWCGCSTADGV